MARVHESSGWELCNWEAFPKDRKGHNALVRQLQIVLSSKYGLKLEKFDPVEAAIAWRVGSRGHPYVPHKPDLVVNVGTEPEDRIFIEYVNTLGNFLRDLRGMLALSAVIKRYRGFLLVVRNSSYPESWIKLNKDSPVEPMPLRSLFHSLDRKNYDWLIGRNTTLNHQLLIS